MKITLVMVLAILLSACDKDPQAAQYQNKDELAIEQNDRIAVSRVGIFRDNLAYNNERGIYIIRDRKTGKEFVGVSGIGIAETGFHTSGKAHHENEQ